MQIVSRGSNIDSQFNQSFSQGCFAVRKGAWQGTALPVEILNTFLNTPYPQPHEFWYAKDENSFLGGLGASVYSQDPNIGFIGFFEILLDSNSSNLAASSLLKGAKEWLKNQGCTQIIGPVNWNTWFPYRFKSTHSQFKTSWEPIHPPEYVDLFKDFGFSNHQGYHSKGLDNLENFVNRTQSAHDNAIANGYTFRALNKETLFTNEIHSLYDISLQGFSDNYLYEPIDKDSFKYLYVPIADKLDLSLAYIVTSPTGEDVGFFFCFKDQDYLVYKSVAVKPSHRGLGLSNAVANKCGQEALKRGIKKMIVAMIKNGAQSESYGRNANEDWHHDYHLFQLEI